MDRMASIHPGEILSEEFLEPLGVTQYRLAKEIGVDPRRIHAIVHGERGIALRRHFCIRASSGTARSSG